MQYFYFQTKNIALWMFLRWIPQLLANVDTNKVFAISDIVEKIAVQYPQSIMYAYRLSKENYSPETENNETKRLIKRLDELLLSDELVQLFLKALSSVSMPANILRYHLGRLLKSHTEGQEKFRSLVDSIIEEIYSEQPDSGDVTRFHGNAFFKIAEYQNHLISLKNLTLSHACRKVRDLDERVKTLLRVSTRELPVNLKDYCPWLANFHSAEFNYSLEIPGQYTGIKKPLPQYHVKIAGFAPKVR